MIKMRNIAKYVRHHGLVRAAHRSGHSALNRAFPYHTFEVMWLSAPTGAISGEARSERFPVRPLTREEVFEVSRLPGTGMQGVYAQDALERGDECLGVVIDGEPVCVCWYARRGPVALYRWWDVEFFWDYVYVHGAYTAPLHRGKRLVEQNLHAAIARYAATSAKGMFALVESSNYASLNAFRRAGYVERATVHTAKIGGRFFVRHGSECRDARIFVVPQPNPDKVRSARESISDAA